MSSAFERSVSCLLLKCASPSCFTVSKYHAVGCDSVGVFSDVQNGVGVRQVARRCPQTSFVLDHCGLNNTGQDFEGWKKSISELAALENVVGCKISAIEEWGELRSCAIMTRCRNERAWLTGCIFVEQIPWMQTQCPTSNTCFENSGASSACVVSCLEPMPQLGSLVERE